MSYGSEKGWAWLDETAIRVRAWETCPPDGRISFFAPDFALSAARPWLTGDLDVRPPDKIRVPDVVRRTEPSAVHFASVHADILSRIDQGQFKKVVPVIAEEMEFSKPLNASMFASHRRPDQFSYGFEFGDEGMCGVTPELLFDVRDGRLHTMALAGTGPADGPDLCQDAKESLEHQLVIENIFQALSPWGAADVGVTREKIYGRLKHLFTPIDLKLRELPPFSDLVKALHPTAALGGFPRQPAMDWLSEQAFHGHRRRFGAPFGFVNGKQMRCVVAIRGIQWQGAKAMLSAGCGVVASSQCEREWSELQLKRHATRELLGLAT